MRLFVAASSCVISVLFCSISFIVASPRRASLDERESEREGGEGEKDVTVKKYGRERGDLMDLVISLSRTRPSILSWPSVAMETSIVVVTAG